MTLHNFSIEVDDAVYQAALERANTEGRTLEAVLAEMVATFAGNKPQQMLTSYTVQRGDTLARIANHVYGDAHKYPLIQSANNLSDPGRIWVGQVLVVPSPGGSGSPSAALSETPPSLMPAPIPPTSPSVPQPLPPPAAPAPAPETPPAPNIDKIDPCAPVSGQSYGSLPIVGPPTDRPAGKHGDINFALRGFKATDSTKGLIDMSGPTDHRAPQLASLFADKRTPEFSAVYQAHHWDWGNNAKGDLITDFEVTVAGMVVEPGEIIHVPKADYSIGQGYAVLVMYASTKRITLKYTGEDSVVSGYTIHVEGICVEPSLLALYRKLNNGKRKQLPALKAEQAFGRAIKNEIQVAIRDTGRFMDPRVRKDWWRQ